LCVKLSFWHFLRLPREIRDRIYGYALLDHRRMTSRNRTYTHSLLSRREHHEHGQQWYRNPLMPTLGPVPALHTPSILRVCKSIQREAWEAVYRTKTLVITVTSIEDKLCDLSQTWPPSVSRFLRIRVDFILACVTTTEMIFKCFRRAASLLLEQALSLQFLEVRVGYSHSNASAAVHDHGFALMTLYNGVANSIRLFAPLIQNQEQRKGRENKPLQITWGVSEAQKK
jgi:hypothetical protein